MKYFIGLLFLSGCATQPLPDNEYQVQAVRIIGAYNAKHHLALEIPEVHIGSTPVPYAGYTWCQKHDDKFTHCFITLNPNVSADMNQTLIHELAHDICVFTVPGYLPQDHGKAWQEIALEIGLSPKDSYINPE